MRSLFRVIPLFLTLLVMGSVQGVAQEPVFDGTVLAADEDPASLGIVANTIVRFGARLAPDDGINADGEIHKGINRNDNRTIFKPVRGLLMNIAMFMIIGMAMFNVLHMMFTASDQAGERLKTLLIQLFTLVIVMQTYHWFDKAIWYGLTIPAVEAMDAGVVVDAMLEEAVKNRDGTANIAAAATNTGSVDDGITARGSAFPQTTGACATEIERDPESGVASKACKQKTEVQAMQKRVIAGRQNDALMPTDSAGRFNPLAFTWDLLSRDFADGGPGAVIREAMSGYAATIMRTWVGAVVGLQELIATAVMWLVWLGAIFTRALSLTLAPVAFALSLMPGKNGRMSQWFLGHAKILLMPAAYSFGFLCFYVVQVAILTTDQLGSGLPGIALQLAMFVMFLILCFKMKDLLAGAAGDVTQIAGSLGDALKDMAVKGTMVAAGVVTGGATMAAGAGISGATSGAAAGAGSGAAGAASGAAGASGTAAKGGLGRMAQNFFSRFPGVASQEDGPVTGIPQTRDARAAGNASGLRGRLDRIDGRVLPAVGGALHSMTLGQMKSAKNRVADGFKSGIVQDRAAKALRAAVQKTPHGESLLKTHDFIRGGTPEKRKEQDKAARKLLADTAKNRVASTPEELAERVGLHAEAIEDAQREAQEKGREFTIPRRRDGERMPRRTSADMVIQAANRNEFNRIESFWNAADGLMVHMKTRLENGLRVPVVSEQTAEAFIKRYLDDADFRAIVDEETRAHAVDMIRTGDGAQVPNVHQLVRRSSVVAQGLLLRAEETAIEETFLIERDKRSRLADSTPGSVADLLIRELPTTVVNPRTAGKDEESQKDYVKRYAAAATRLAYARMMGIERDIHDIIHDESLDADIEAAGWTRESALLHVDDSAKVQEFMDKARSEMEAFFSTAATPTGPAVHIDQQRYGAELGEYLLSLGRRRKYAGHETSIYEIELFKRLRESGIIDRDEGTARHHEVAYQDAFDIALDAVIERLTAAGVNVPDRTDQEAWDAFVAAHQEKILHQMFQPNDLSSYLEF